MVFDAKDQYPSQWAAIESIAGKIGCSGETLRKCRACRCLRCRGNAARLADDLDDQGGHAIARDLGVLERLPPLDGFVVPFVSVFHPYGTQDGVVKARSLDGFASVAIRRQGAPISRRFHSPNLPGTSS